MQEICRVYITFCNVVRSMPKTATNECRIINLAKQVE